MRLGNWSPHLCYEKGRYVAIPRVGSVLVPGKLSEQFIHYDDELISRVARESIPCHDKPLAVYVGVKAFGLPCEPTVCAGYQGQCISSQAKDHRQDSPWL